MEGTTVVSNRRRKYWKLFFRLSLILAIFYLGVVEGRRWQKESDLAYPIEKTQVINRIPYEKKELDFSLFWKVWDLTKEKFIGKDSLDAKELMYGAIRGMLSATKDPYSTFFDPKESKSFAQDMQGNFDGIGAELGVKDGILTIVAPLEDSPAAKAGLRSGDKIIKIDNISTSDLSVDQAVDKIRGKKGTNVTLTIFRSGEEKTQDITLMRDTIEIKSVKWEMKGNNIAYIKINKFGEETAKEFNEVANQLVLAKAKGIILDLRNNPGGFLDRSVDVASRLMAKGRVVVLEEDSAGEKTQLVTNGRDNLSNLPVVVLLNEGSASASEILAGALRDNRQVEIVGKKSFGKGSVQELISLPDGSSVKISVAKWMTPNGDSITEKGISPTVEVELTSEDFNNNRDPQLEKAMEIIQEKL